MATTYTVKKGDTLSKIAREYGTTYQDIAKENGISNPDLIYAGQTLTIGGQKNNAAAPASIEAPASVAPNAAKPASIEAPAGTNTNTGSNNSANGGATGNETFTTPAGNTYNSFSYDEFTYDPFQGSDTLNQAWATLGQLQGNAPGEWVDPYKDKYMGYLNQYENRDPFSYDFNSDALYQQYKDQYIQQGQMAMMDTMGQAAAMTGGYGNSYAQTVGQQVYNQHLGQLNEIMPELYDRAYGIYQQEGQELLDMYNAYLGLSQNEYNQYLGGVDRYFKELDAASNYANNLYNMEYGEWSDKTKMDFDTWSANTGLSFDEWATETGIISDENNTLMNQKFQADENQKDRDHQTEENDKNRQWETDENNKTREENNRANAKSDLIDLIASTGYEPTEAELEAAGMTREQAKGYAKAYEDAKTAAAVVPYGTLNTEDTMQWIKKFEGAEDLDALEAYTNALQGIIGPEAAAIWFDTYAKKFKDKEPPKVETIGTGGRGGGLSTVYNEIK